MALQLLAALLIAALAGCSPRPADSPDSAPDEALSNGGDSAFTDTGLRPQDAEAKQWAADNPDSQMQPVSFAQWQTVRAAKKPAILVVDLWASWCVPCLERFPEMIRMSREYQHQNVEFVSLSLDDRDDPEGVAFANEFLRKQNPPFANYFLDENIIDGFEKLGIMGVPAVDIYARDGTRAHRLTGDNPNAQFTEKDVENALATMLVK